MRRPPTGRHDRPTTSRRGAVERRVEQLRIPPSAQRRVEILQRQRTLAERVVSFLRDGGPDPRVGLAAGALLLATAGGAFAYDVATEPPVESVELAPVQPLAQEVRTGLPTESGRYPVDPATVSRDAQGVFRFSWQDPSGVDHPAAVSLLKQAPGDLDELAIPAEGDPILYLREDTPVQVIAEEASASGSGSGSSSGSRAGFGGGSFVYIGNWYPYTGSYTREPVYRAPSSSSPDSSSFTGSVESSSPRPLAARTIQVPSRVDAVSGMSRGTGGGSAVSAKSGVTVGRSAVSAPRSGGFSSGGLSSAGGASSGGASSS
jgi:hypothetical protein